MITEKGKTDKGFQLLYYRLSYRRKFIRTLWFVPPTIILIWFVINSETLFNNNIIAKIILSILLIIIMITQLADNYNKWKKQEG